MTAVADQVEKRTRRRKTTPKEKKNLKYEGPYLSTGSVLLNLAISDRWDGGYKPGTMANIIGDSHTGKTILALTAGAEAVNDPDFKDYDVIFDDAEWANDFDIENIFGPKLAEKMRAPSDDEDNLNSERIEDFHDNVLTAVDRGKPFIYILDSFDSIGAEADDKKIEEHRDARKKGTQVKGSYGLAKARKSSELLRHVCGIVKKTNSILIIISQTRDNINPLSRKKTTRSGGRALKFYASVEAWLVHIMAISKLKLPIGNRSKAKVTKTKQTGKIREVDIAIYQEFGVDNVGPVIDFLTEDTEYWKKNKNTILVADVFDKDMTKGKLIKHIEENNLEIALWKIAEKAWLKREASLGTGRKKRFQ